MVPSFTLGGWLTRPLSKEDTPTAICKGFFMTKQDADGIRQVDLERTCVESCVMQRGYGTVVMQIKINAATNRRLQCKCFPCVFVAFFHRRCNLVPFSSCVVARAPANADPNGITLPIDTNGVRAIYAIGETQSQQTMPFMFHNEKSGDVWVDFDESSGNTDV